MKPTRRFSCERNILKEEFQHYTFNEESVQHIVQYNAANAASQLIQHLQQMLRGADGIKVRVEIVRFEIPRTQETPKT